LTLIRDKPDRIRIICQKPNVNSGGPLPCTGTWYFIAQIFYPEVAECAACSELSSRKELTSEPDDRSQDRRYCILLQRNDKKTRQKTGHSVTQT